jgi:hypothetical protein
MPPWGAVKGFGDFRNDQGLTQEEIELITDWVEDGTPRGNNPNMLPKEPKFKKPDAVKIPKNAVSVSSDLKLDRPFVLDGLWIDTMPDRAQMQIVASLPDGTIEPLLWLYEYNARFKHAFLLRDPLALPAGTVIRGVLPGASVTLLPGKK